MIKEPRIILNSQEARKKLKKGIDTVADIIKTTLGNGGRNVIFELNENLNIITNDGVSIAEQIYLEDPTENMGAYIVREACQKTNLEVGDGTTTSALLTQAILEKGFNILETDALLNKTNPVKIKKQIDQDLKIVLEELDKASKKITTAKEREDVAMTSVEDKDLAKMISEVLGKVGHNSHITLEQVEALETSYEIIEGVRINRGWFAPFMINRNNGNCELKNPYILVTDQPLNDPQTLARFSAYASENNSPLVVIADDFSPQVLGTIAVTRQKTGYEILAIKAQEFQKEEHLTDVAIITGATYISKQKDMQLESQIPEQVLGKSKVVVSDKEETHISGGYGDKKVLADRLKEYQTELDYAKETAQKDTAENLEKRISRLTTGTVIVKIGADSRSERDYKYRKVEDAFNATKVAMQEGVVRGGGVELTAIAKKLPDDNFFKDIITKPQEQILKNSAEDKIDESVIDPTKVVKTALKTASSVSGTLLTTEATIALPKKDLAKTLKETLT